MTAPYAKTLKYIALEAGVSQREVRRVVELLFLHARDRVKADGRFLIPYVGVFLARKRAARRVMNPATRDLMTLGETRSVGFRPASRGVFRP